MIGHLQDTGKLVTDTQMAETGTKYPFQMYRRGTPTELLVATTAANMDIRVRGHWQKGSGYATIFITC